MDWGSGMDWGAGTGCGGWALRGAEAAPVATSDMP
jgi:hypothetical protein